MNKEQQELITNNQRLVHYFAHRFNPKNEIEYNTYFDAGMDGLIKAALTYDKTKKIKFGTYAGVCIKHEIGMYLRKNKKGNIVSLDDIISNDDDSLKLEDKIGYTENFEEAENRELFIKATKILLNYLNYREAVTILYRMGEMLQEDIGTILGVSRSYISRLERNGTAKIKEMYMEDIDDDQNLYIDVINDYFIFCFNYNLIADINNFLKSFLKYLKTIEDLPYLKVTYNKKYIKVYLVRDIVSFIIIAKIIQEFAEFIKIGTKSNLCIVPEKKEKTKKETSSEIIIKYILSKEDLFTVKEIQMHFLGRFDYKDISRAIYSAKSKNFITKVDRGKYVVNKN